MIYASDKKLSCAGMVDEELSIFRGGLHPQKQWGVKVVISRLFFENRMSRKPLPWFSVVLNFPMLPIQVLRFGEIRSFLVILGSRLSFVNFSIAISGMSRIIHSFIYLRHDAIWTLKCFLFLQKITNYYWHIFVADGKIRFFVMYLIRNKHNTVIGALWF